MQCTTACILLNFSPVGWRLLRLGRGGANTPAPKMYLFVLIYSNHSSESAKIYTKCKRCNHADFSSYKWRENIHM